MKPFRLNRLKRNPIGMISLIALAVFVGYVVIVLLFENKNPSKCGCPYQSTQNEAKQDREVP